MCITTPQGRSVCACFPSNGVIFIMGNDVAGSRVLPGPETVVNPIPQSKHYNLAKRQPGVFVANVLTQAQSLKQTQNCFLLSWLRIVCLLLVMWWIFPPRSPKTATCSSRTLAADSKKAWLSAKEGG